MTRLAQRVARLLSAQPTGAGPVTRERQDPRWAWSHEHPEILWTLVAFTR